MLTTTSYANAWQETLQNQSKYFVCTSYDACKSLRNKGNDDGNDDGNTDGNEQNRKHVNSEQSGESRAYRFEISTKIWLSAETRKPICNKCKGKNDIRIKSLEHLNACLYSAENTFQVLKTQEIDRTRGRESDGGTARRKARAMHYALCLQTDVHAQTHAHTIHTKNTLAVRRQSWSVVAKNS